MAVTVVTTKKEFDEIIASEEPAVFDFWATWCGPCRVVSPVFEQLSNNYPSIRFYKVDIDEAEEIAKSEECKITAVPTFMVFKSGKKLDQVRGAVPAKLQQMIQQHA